MEANKSECEKCIRIAQNAIASKDYEKANKFLSKAQKLYPSELVNNMQKEIAEKSSQEKQYNSEKHTEEDDAYNYRASDSNTNKENNNTKSNKKNNQQENSSDQSDALKKLILIF